VNIGIDVDGTLIDMHGFMLEKGKRFFRRDASDPYALNIEGMFSCTPKEGKRFWLRYLVEYCLFPPMIEDAAQTVRRLRCSGHRIYIITSRIYTDREGLAGLFPRMVVRGLLKRKGVPYDGIAFCKDTGEEKLKYCRKFAIDVMIDDKPENLITIGEECPVIVSPMPWNAYLEDKGYIRAKNWANTYDIITSMMHEC
jgi:uncharacterized HAD superfamily protein